MLRVPTVPGHFLVLGMQAVMQAVSLDRVHIEELRVRIVRGRGPIGGSAVVRRYQGAANLGTIHVIVPAHDAFDRPAIRALLRQALKELERRR